MLNGVKSVVSKVVQDTNVNNVVVQQIEITSDQITSVFTMSDKKINDLIYATHVHADESFDEDSLFIIVENVLKSSNQIIDKIVQGIHVHDVDNLSCKAPNEVTAHETTLAILNKLSNYSWEAKAVLALAAFAFEFGDFWLIAQLYNSDSLAKQLGVLKRVPSLIKTSELVKRRQAVLELSSLVNVTMRVIAMFDEFEKLSAYDVKDIPGLSVALDHLPVDVYWAILTIAACATKHCILISDKGGRDLQEALQAVNIDVLRRKNVFMFFSGVEITEEDISILKPVYEETKKEKSYTIVWIPIVEKWSDEIKKKYETLKSKMPWYCLHQFGPIAGIRFIKEQWQYQGKPMLVLTTPQGKVENLNALHLIRVWGIKAFPFDKKSEEIISKEIHWIGSLVKRIDPIIETWVKEEKYIFFYGGKDKDLIETFTKKVTALASNPFIKEAKINIKFFCVGKTTKGEEDHGNILGRFWGGIESLFFTKDHNKDVDPVTQEIQKLLSYKNESAWAILSKGSAVVTSGHGSTILKVVEEFEQWKEVIKVKGFEVGFKEVHTKVTQTIRHCIRLDVPTVAGKAPDCMKCPECLRAMETYISYKCCHVDPTTQLLPSSLK
ncbi:hypothetical protein G4B88_014670 [Cannabis sativa]|uniref:Protein SIEVE ELEMENT OCCLUSION B n=1 Tax=Cannabis sativa TaxID=3483 RepID=A0A7J6I9F0_CANSA|nr:hypothetical protein G4B88_014670 [Cannabis sativa]